MAYVHPHVNLSRRSPISLSLFIYNFGLFNWRDTLPAAKRSDGTGTDQTTVLINGKPTYREFDELWGCVIRSCPVLQPCSWRVPIFLSCLWR